MTVTADDSLDTLFNDAHVQHADPLRTVMDAMASHEPHPRAVPNLWRWDVTKPLLDRPGDLAGTEEAERRGLYRSEAA